MTDSSAQLRRRQNALAARLGEPSAAAERDELKAELTLLYRAVESELAALQAVKTDVLALITRWKALPEGAPGTKRATPHADHLGASTFIERGWHQISTGDAAGAEASLLRALELAPDDPQTEALLAWAQMLQGRYGDARARLTGLLGRDEHNALARANLGFICLREGALDEAVQHLDRVMRDESDRKATLYAQYYLGLVQVAREEHAEAAESFRRALALGPNLIEAYVELGRALWFGGQEEEARGAWREGFQANKFSPWGKRCEELLQTVDGGGSPARGG